jgi:hypothetical protein
MVKSVGAEGAIHASEVEQEKVDEMKEKFADTPQVKPYLSPLDGTALPENSCDLRRIGEFLFHLVHFLLLDLRGMNDAFGAHGLNHLCRPPAVAGSDVHHNVTRSEV